MTHLDASVILKLVVGKNETGALRAWLRRLRAADHDLTVADPPCGVESLASPA